METYLKVLDPDDSSAGGGSASAIAGAMAGALVALAAKFSRPSQRKVEGDDRPFEDMAGRAMALSTQLRLGALEDTQAFQSVRDSYRLPKGTDEEKAVRQKAVQAAWLAATRKPLANAEACLGILALGGGLAPDLNPAVRSDFSSGLYLARAGLLGCLDNVRINLPSIKDTAIAAEIDAAAEACRRRADALAAGLALPPA